MHELQNQMQDQVNYLIAQQNQHKPFSCNASFGGSFAINVEKKQDEHDNSRNGSKVGNATKEIFNISSGPQPCSNSNAAQLKPPAKSQSTPSKRSKNEDKTSPKPTKSKSHDEEKTEVYYYTTFPEPERIHGEPMLVQMQDSKTVMCTAIQMPSFSALQVVFFSLISHQVKIQILPHS